MRKIEELIEEIRSLNFHANKTGSRVQLDNLLDEIFAVNKSNQKCIKDIEQEMQLLSCENEELWKKSNLWTSIKNKDRKIPVGVPLIVTIYDSCRGRRELRYPVVYRKSLYSNHYCFYMYGSEESVLIAEYSEVLAWTEFPKIFEGYY